MAETTTATPPTAATPVKPNWPSLADDHALNAFHKRLSGILSDTGYAEIWGIELSAASPPPFTTFQILQKFLRANQNNLDKAAEQLGNTLKWRKEFQPLELLKRDYSSKKFKGLGYNTKVVVPDGTEKVVCWNVYGDVESIKETFGDLDEFIRFRVALMELTIQNLNIATSTTPIPDFSSSSATFDPYQAIQVHDYKGISFLRPDPLVKAASSKTIELFSKYYPELLEKKFFVNVPWIMEKFFATFKLILPAATTKKFVLLNKGSDLVKRLGSDIPQAYGGTKESLAVIGETVPLSAAESVSEEEAPALVPVAEAKTEESDASTPAAAPAVADAPVATSALASADAPVAAPAATPVAPEPVAATAAAEESKVEDEKKASEALAKEDGAAAAPAGAVATAEVIKEETSKA
ncbi:CRAL/TRIO domain-containing protein [Ascobolus immersus RN42]|uniref:Phosphatidylinositol transfer protein SFH5 n=1 Tax=Ascobolus immersus RN42 TaxID=1160509 RepID=A0A3N4IEP4_ASCIM|nr:CRAL/TRIO domain-containing protein [Ascobolus immersus RN42]